MSVGAKVDFCSSSNESPAFSYEWRCRDGNNSPIDLTLVTKTTFPDLLIPAFFLEVNEIYTFWVQVTVLGQSSIEIFEVMIVPSDLFAVIAGGPFQYWRVGDEIDLDASDCYDPDYPDTRMTYDWDCSVFSGEASMILCKCL